MRPYSSNSIENATLSSGTSPLVSYKDVPPPPPPPRNDLRMLKSKLTSSVRDLILLSYWSTSSACCCKSSPLSDASLCTVLLIWNPTQNKSTVTKCPSYWLDSWTRMRRRLLQFLSIEILPQKKCYKCRKINLCFTKYRWWWWWWWWWWWRRRRW